MKKLFQVLQFRQFRFKVGSHQNYSGFAVWAKRIIRSQDLHHNVDYTPYEGLEIEGWPLTVLSRGEVVIEKEKLLVAPGRGEFLVCNKPDMARPKVA